MIRPATLADVEGLAELLRSLAEFPRFAEEPLEATLTRVTEALAANAEQTLLVAEDEGQIAGFVLTLWQPSLLRSGGEGFISELFIRSEHRGQGLGQALLSQIREEGQQRGCSRLSLLNMRDVPSYERGFYAKLGWEERPYAANFVLNLEKKN